MGLEQGSDPRPGVGAVFPGSAESLGGSCTGKDMLSFLSGP